MAAEENPNARFARQNTGLVLRQFSWKPGIRAFNRRDVDVQAAGEHLTALTEERGGFVRPADVVDSARPAESPIHKAFEWNDQAAAEDWREHQARNLLNSIAVNVVLADRQDEELLEEPVVAFVHIRDEENNHGYVQVERALGDERTRAQVLKEALMYLKGFERRYGQFEELSAVFNALPLVEQEVRSIAEEPGKNPARRRKLNRFSNLASSDD